MNRTSTEHAFDGKAEVYARYRPDYAPQAIDAILAIAGLNKHSTIADLGAGTGMLARHFADRVGRVFAIEPNAEMRAVARSSLRRFTSLRVLDGTAQATGLPDRSVDAVTAGRAIQWFDPVPSRTEMQRILRPGGWLIVVRTPLTDAYSSAAIARLHDERISHHEKDRRHHQPQADPVDYFGDDNYIRLAYPCEAHESWPEFFGRVQSLSPSPRPDEPKYGEFARVAREIFDSGAVNGVLRLEYTTEVLMKRIATPPAQETPGGTQARATSRQEKQE